jgi:hypothetical protein
MAGVAVKFGRVVVGGFRLLLIEELECSEISHDRDEEETNCDPTCVASARIHGGIVPVAILVNQPTLHGLCHSLSAPLWILIEGYTLVLRAITHPIQHAKPKILQHRCEHLSPALRISVFVFSESRSGGRGSSFTCKCSSRKI